MLKICLIAGTFQWTLPVTDFTLAWNHSVEKIRWEEDYRLDGRDLVLYAARIRGSGAGMEPPADAVFRKGVWHYEPNRRVERLTLANSSYGGAYEVCVKGECRELPVSESGAVIRWCER